MMKSLTCLLAGMTFGTVHAADVHMLNASDTHSYKAEDGTTLLYALAEPSSPQPGKRYPLVIFLHGAGGTAPVGERNTQRAWDGAAQFFETMSEECYFFMPQATGIWAGIPWEKLPYRMNEEPTQLMQAVIECIDRLRQEKAVDPQRIYVAGTSMGSMGMWDLVCRRPELFAAAISCCGGFDPEQAPRLVNIKFRIFHGDADEVVPAEGSRRMFDALRTAGADVAYHVFPGAYHAIWDQTYRNRENINWLFRQRQPDTTR
jgi:predicted peptidase